MRTAVFAACRGTVWILALAVSLLGVGTHAGPAGLALAAGATGAQAIRSSSVKPGWTPDRLSDGQDDLQGTWVSRTATPLERPKALEGRDRLTDKEVAELQQRANQMFATGASDFAAGDAVFMAALEDRSTFKSTTATAGADEMTIREFDHHTSLVTDPPDGRIPPLTPAGIARRNAMAQRAEHPTQAEDLSNAFRCIAWGVPRLGGRYGAGDYGFHQIVQVPGYVMIYFEIGHEYRLIPLDGRPHPPAHVRFWNGDSRGRWEGHTLVVDTTNFSEKSYFMGSSDGLHLVERFTRVSPDTIIYQMTFDDPTTWTRPWTAEMPLKQTNEQIYEYGCHEGNRDVVEGILRGMQATEWNAR